MVFRGRHLTLPPPHQPFRLRPVSSHPDHPHARKRARVGSRAGLRGVIGVTLARGLPLRIYLQAFSLGVRARAQNVSPFSLWVLQESSRDAPLPPHIPAPRSSRPTFVRSRALAWVTGVEA